MDYMGRPASEPRKCVGILRWCIEVSGEYFARDAQPERSEAEETHLGWVVSSLAPCPAGIAGFHTSTECVCR